MLSLDPQDTDLKSEVLFAQQIMIISSEEWEGLTQANWEILPKQAVYLNGGILVF